MKYTPTDEYSTYQLAHMADVTEPDVPRGRDGEEPSPGADWLHGVRDALAEAVEYDGFDPDELHELADGAVEIYTYRSWKVFTDLAMWQVDISDLTDSIPADDLEKVAQLTQYVSAETLMRALLEDWEDNDEEDDDEDEDDDLTD